MYLKVIKDVELEACKKRAPAAIKSEPGEVKAYHRHLDLLRSHEQQ
jgi:hypothetical protein